jgi:cytochrome c oxidase cbb3-type subunit 3
MKQINNKTMSMEIACNNRPLRNKIGYFISLLFLTLLPFSASAKGETAYKDSLSLFSNPMFLVLLSIIILLLILIVMFADVVKAAAENRGEQEKKKRGPGAGIKAVLVLAATLASADSLMAQGVVQTGAGGNSYWGLDAFTFYLMITIIAFEMFIIWALRKISMELLGAEERKQRLAEQKAKAVVKQPSIIEKLNASVAVEKEADIMLDHNYDGIRELDNNLPPWWKYGFYITIVWAVIYMIHFHVSNTGKLQLAEYEDQLAIAKAQVDEYRKKAANLVDENNATLLTDQASLAAGQSVFMDNCAACHGRAGEGGVGPNLTDDYWLHSGSIGAIFKTIKYGYPEKGMKAWQQDLGAKQIHEVSSFIMSLRGTNPANAKEKQGELYINSAVVDSAATATVDSSLIVLTGK